MGDVAVQNWCEAPTIHASQVKVGDIIGTPKQTELRYTVKMISGPQRAPRRWTFFCRDNRGLDHTSTFGEDDLVRRYAKAP
jgi:hypothetical protein